jgi:hypothetical protein
MGDLPGWQGERNGTVADLLCTVTEAHRAGKVALKQLMAKSFPKRIPILRMDLS